MGKGSSKGVPGTFGADWHMKAVCRSRRYPCFPNSLIYCLLIYCLLIYFILRLLSTTERDEKAIAAPAIMGLSKKPLTG